MNVARARIIPAILALVLLAACDAKQDETKAGAPPATDTQTAAAESGGKQDGNPQQTEHSRHSRGASLQEPAAPARPTEFHLIAAEAETATPDNIDAGPEPAVEPVTYKALYEMFVAENAKDIVPVYAAIRYDEVFDPHLSGTDCPASSPFLHNEILAAEEIQKLKANFVAVRDKLLAAPTHRRFEIKYEQRPLDQYDMAKGGFPLTFSRSRAFEFSISTETTRTGYSSIKDGVDVQTENICNEYYTALESAASQGLSEDEKGYFANTPEKFNFTPDIEGPGAWIAPGQTAPKSKYALPDFLPMDAEKAKAFIARNEQRRLVIDVVYDARAKKIRPAVWSDLKIEPADAFDITVAKLTITDPTNNEILMTWISPPRVYRDPKVPDDLAALYAEYGAKSYDGRLLGAEIKYDSTRIIAGGAQRILDLLIFKAYPQLADDPDALVHLAGHLPPNEEARYFNMTKRDRWAGRDEAEQHAKADAFKAEAAQKVLANAARLPLPLPMVAVTKVRVLSYDSEKGGVPLNRSSDGADWPYLHIVSEPGWLVPTIADVDLPDFLPMSEDDANRLKARLREDGDGLGYEVFKFDVVGVDKWTRSDGTDTASTYSLRIKPVSAAVYADPELTTKVLAYDFQRFDFAIEPDKAPLKREGADIPSANFDSLSLLYLGHGRSDLSTDYYKNWFQTRAAMEKKLWAAPAKWRIRDPWANYVTRTLASDIDAHMTDQEAENFAAWSKRRADGVGDAIKFWINPGMMITNHDTTLGDLDLNAYYVGDELRFESGSLASQVEEALDARFGADKYAAYSTLMGNDGRTAVVVFEAPADKPLDVAIYEKFGRSAAAAIRTRITGFESLKTDDSDPAEIFVVRVKPQSIVFRDEAGAVVKQLPVRFK